MSATWHLMGPRGLPGESKMPPKIPGVSNILPKSHPKMMKNAIVDFFTLRTSQKTDKRSPKVVQIRKTTIKSRCPSQGRIARVSRNLAEKSLVVSLLAWRHMFLPDSLRAYLPGNKIEFQQYSEPESLNQIESTKQYDD